ncbi:phosphoric diester hydrolase [Malassezia pachydermatis]|uniref:Putative acid sphingomyelinase n=1 Tax=Malassezia pachydermatis TaxID=77020 RepID=A0A0M8MPG4_9BASI|nr:putative acid sphingomyelinase [Malassezia pachydermatis]KOS15698.1 putative acid sphingomyelinase [Malassezia pachydermatis]
MQWLRWLGVSALVLASGAMAVDTTSGTPVFTGAKAFPTSLFPSMYYMPKNMEQEPRPVITREGGGQFPDSLNNPRQLPTQPPANEALMPNAVAGSSDLDALIGDVWDIAGQLFRGDKGSSLTCNLCRSGLETLQKITHIDPDLVPDLLGTICETFNVFGLLGFGQQCKRTLSAAVYGGPITMVLSYANLTGAAPDATGICAQIPSLNLCEHPSEKLSDDFLNDWFHGSRHAPQDVVERWEKKRARAYGSDYDASKNLRVAHISDLHLDGRYFVGGESDCTWGATVQCCRVNSYNNTKFHGQFVHGQLDDSQIVHKANYWGSLECDTPWSLMVNSMEALQSLGGDNGFDLALFTGDLVAHDDLYRYSRDFARYSEQAIFDLLKTYLGSTPLIPALGNHDTSPENMMAPPAQLPDNTASHWDWDLSYVSKLWRNREWIGDQQVEDIRKHHGAFSVTPRKGLRVISLNTDFWYYVNMFNYIHMSNPDVSGMLRFLTDELFEAEKNDERVWIVGHVLSGWDGGEALDRPSNLFYQIVSRFAPHTLAAIFFGHTHEDQFQVFYFNDNGEAKSAQQTTEHAVSMAYVAPSITPYTKLNPTIRVYSVHPDTYEIMEFEQYYTPIATFDELVRSGANHGPVWRQLYTARELYGDFHASVRDGTYKAGVELHKNHWPQNAPLNGTFWAALTDEMEARPSLATTFSEVQTRNSPTARRCTTSDCIKNTICYMRAGSASQGRKCDGQYSSMGR